MLSRGLEKISTTRGHICAPCCSLSRLGERFSASLHRMYHRRCFWCCLSFRSQWRSALTGYLFSINQTLLGLFSSRASKVLGPNSRYRVADILHVKEAVIIVGGLFIPMAVFASLMAKLLLDGCDFQTLHGRIDFISGPVVTTVAHLALSGARTHSNTTAEMTAMIEALSFLGLHGLVARDEQSCIHHDSQYDESADHAAALGTFGLTSGHIDATRWIHNFDASVCFDGGHNINEVLERLQHIRCDATSIPQKRS